MRKKILTLTSDQKARGVIFSSELIGGGVVHEVFNTMSQEEQKRKIDLLMDDKFFNDSPYKYNLIRKN